MTHYTAFISYRHVSPDADIAKKLASYIENFSIPAQIKSSRGIKRMGRVFRDQDELTLSTDLGEDIHRALENSDWLICICSPKYLASRWCMEELRYFISLGKQDHILTVLAEGEPSESFPPELCFREEDGRTIEIEPLAADVRADTIDVSIKKLKSEKLRLIATMLGISYDDLRQRARRRRTRIAAGLITAAFAALAGFLGYTVHKNAEITAQRNEALTAESKWLAKSANEALDNGEMMLSLLLSLEALPKDLDDPDRPFVSDALYSLQNAIFSGSGDDLYHSVDIIDIPGLESFRASENEIYCFSRLSPGYITAWDLNTGKALEPAYSFNEAPINCFFSNRLVPFAVYPDHIDRGTTNISNSILGKDEKGDYIVGEVREGYPSFSGLFDDMTAGGGYLLLSEEGSFSGYQIYNTAFRDYQWENASLGDLQSWSEQGFIPKDARSIAAKSGTGWNCYVIGGYRSESYADAAPAVIMVNIMKGHSDQDNTVFRYYIDGEKAESVRSSPNMSNTYYMVDKIDVSCDDSIIAGYWRKAMYFWNAGESKMISSLDMSLFSGSNISIVKAAFSGAEREVLAVLTDDSRVYILDCVNQKVLNVIEPGLYLVKDFQWNKDSSRLLLSCDDDAARIVSVAEGELLQTIPCSFKLKKAEYGSRDYSDNSADDTYVLLYGADNIQIWRRDSLDPELSLTRRINDQAFGTTNTPLADKEGSAQLLLSEDEKTLWVCTKEGMAVYDMDTLERIKTLYPGISGLRVAMSGGSAYIYMGSNNDDAAGNLRIVDTETLEETGVISSNYPHSRLYRRTDGTVSVTDRSEKLGINNISFSGDGSLLMVNTGSSVSHEMEQSDPSIFVYDTGTHEELWHIGFDGGDISDKIFSFATDWPAGDFFLLKGWFLKGGEKVLCQYIYGDKGYSVDGRSLMRSHMAFEVRDAKTGAVERTWQLPWFVRVFIYYTESDVYIQNDSNYAAYTRAVPESIIDSERGVIIVQETDYTVHVVELETGNEIASIEAESVIKRVSIDDQKLRMMFALPSVRDETTFSSKSWEVSFDGNTDMLENAVLGPKHGTGSYYGSIPIYALSDGIYDAEEDEMIIRLPAKYHFFRSFAGGGKLLLSYDGELIIMDHASTKELQDLAQRILDGRELTKEQKQKYFLE